MDNLEIGAPSSPRPAGPIRRRSSRRTSIITAPATTSPSERCRDAHGEDRDP